MTFAINAVTRLAVVVLVATGNAAAQNPGAPLPEKASEQNVEKLLRRLEADESRIRELEQKLGLQTPSAPVHALEPADPAPAPALTAPAYKAPEPESTDAHDHMIEIPGGPALKFKGFTDLNAGGGQLANPLIFPLGATAHNSFQIGEFDLFMSSRISSHLSFVAELVVGADRTNSWGLDIERIQVTYKANPFFEVSAGRYHSAIGYYNTTFHHGTWFQTATGRPLMYYFEDSGGLLPMHNVGVTTTGLVPHTGKLNLHWVAEAGNGRTSSLSPDTQPVQNFLSDRNHKSVNFAAYIKPQWLEGMQIGGNLYRDHLYPDGVSGVRQTASGLYAVFINSSWEFLNEGVLLRHESDMDHRAYNSPLFYTQVSKRFGEYRPYLRYQYVNAVEGDPLNAWHGRYTGPSVGVRYNISEYAAFKIQYNQLFHAGGAKSLHGLDTQLAFTF